MLDTFTRRSFQVVVVIGFALLLSLLNVVDDDDAANSDDAGNIADEEGPNIFGAMALLSRRLLFDLGDVKARVDGRRLSNMASFLALLRANEVSRRADVDDDNDMSSSNDVISEVGLIDIGIGVTVAASALFVVVVVLSSKCSSNVISNGWW
jgi:hypothetical protein